MIEAARELAVFAQQHVEQAKAAAAKCTDPVLKEQIITSAQAAKNWSVQLKIIAAVKVLTLTLSINKNNLFLLTVCVA